MKIISFLVTVSLLSSCSQIPFKRSVASEKGNETGNRETLDPDEVLRLSTESYLSAKKRVEENADSGKKTIAKAKAIAAQLSQTKTNNKTLTALYKSCGSYVEFAATNAEWVGGIDNSMDKSEIDNQYIDLETSISSYKNLMSECKECDVTEKDKKVKALEAKINKLSEQLALSAKPVTDGSEKFMNTNYCNLSNMYIKEDGRGVEGFSHRQDINEFSVSPKVMLDPQFKETFEYIGSHAPIKIKRKVTSNKTASAAFKDGAVEIQFLWDKKSFFKEGRGDVLVAPEEVNPFFIIHKGR